MGLVGHRLQSIRRLPMTLILARPRPDVASTRPSTRDLRDLQRRGQESGRMDRLSPISRGRSFLPLRQPAAPTIFKRFWPSTSDPDWSRTPTGRSTPDSFRRIGTASSASPGRLAGSPSSTSTSFCFRRSTRTSRGPGAVPRLPGAVRPFLSLRLFGAPRAAGDADDRSLHAVARQSRPAARRSPTRAGSGGFRTLTLFRYWGWGHQTLNTERQIADPLGPCRPVDVLRINHYWSRSLADLEAKIARTDVLAREMNADDYRWREQSYNAIEDRTIIELAAQTGNSRQGDLVPVQVRSAR